MNNLLEDYIRMCLTCRSLASCSTLSVLLTSRIHVFDFINISGHSRLINSILLAKIEDQFSGRQWSSKWDSTLKQAHVQLVNKQPSDFWFHQGLRCFRVVWSQFWTSSNFVSALETTANNQKVKRSLYRLQNVNNLPEDYIRVCLICRSLTELFNFISLVPTS